jgi:hypothetical protein
MLRSFACWSRRNSYLSLPGHCVCSFIVQVRLSCDMTQVFEHALTCEPTLLQGYRRVRLYTTRTKTCTHTTSSPLKFQSMNWKQLPQYMNGHIDILVLSGAGLLCRDAIRPLVLLSLTLSRLPVS